MPKELKGQDSVSAGAEVFNRIISRAIFIIFREFAITFANYIRFLRLLPQIIDFCRLDDSEGFG
jgi:hypothetical protein